MGDTLSSSEKLEETIELFQLLTKLNNETTAGNNSNKDALGGKVGFYISLVPAVAIIVGGIFWFGLQTNKWDDTRKNTILELRAEFTSEFSEQQKGFNFALKDFEDEIKAVREDNRNLRIIIEAIKDDVEENTELIEEAESKDELRDRTADNLYRNQQYLKSLHNINTPPN